MTLTEIALQNKIRNLQECIGMGVLTCIALIFGLVVLLIELPDKLDITVYSTIESNEEKFKSIDPIFQGELKEGGEIEINGYLIKAK